MNSDWGRGRDESMSTKTKQNKGRRLNESSSYDLRSKWIHKVKREDL